MLRTVQAFPADDVTLPVLDAALEAVAHIVMNTRENQQYIRLKGDSPSSTSNPDPNPNSELLTPHPSPLTYPPTLAEP